jgi:cysteine-rich repeat protein
MERTTLSRLQLVIGASSFLLIVITGFLVAGGRTSGSKHGAAKVEVMTGTKDASGNESALSKDGELAIPLPFGGASASGLKGDITQIGRNIYKVTFPGTLESEQLVEDHIYLVYSPDTPDVNTVALDIAVGANKNYYGYKYSDVNATDEKAAAPNAPFNVRFPAEFFASATALQQDPNLAQFALANGITWHPTAGISADSVIMERNQLYLFIVNEQQGATVSVRGIEGLCGNLVVEAAEECDNGVIDHDGCTNECIVQNGYSCTGSPSVCDWNGQRGDLLVSMSSTPVASKQLLGGVLGGAVARFSFEARKEDIDVTNLNITVKSYNNAGMAVDRLELYFTGATEPFASATVGGCGAQTVPGMEHRTFCAVMNNQEFVVPQGEQMHVLVRPVMKSDADGGYINNNGVNFTLIPGYGSETEGLTYRPVGARGLTTQETLLDNDKDGVFEGEVVVGRTSLAAYPEASYDLEMETQKHHIVLSKLASIENANPDFNGTAVPSGSQRAVGQFRFTTFANTNTQNGVNKVQLRDLYFTVLADNVEVNDTNPKMYNKADANMKQDCQFMSGTVAPNTRLVRCTGLENSVVLTALDAGSSNVFVLQLDITNPKINSALPSVLGVSLSDFSDINKPLLNENGDVVSHVRWLDKDAGTQPSNVGPQSFTWFDLPYDTVKSTLYGDVPAMCGNGIIEGDEQCDDGNQNNNDDCNNECQLTTPTPFP